MGDNGKNYDRKRRDSSSPHDQLTLGCGIRGPPQRAQRHERPLRLREPAPARDAGAWRAVRHSSGENHTFGTRSQGRLS
jgi:hypothetical protein